MRRQSDITQYFFLLFSRLYKREITPEKAVAEMNTVLGGTQTYWQRPPSHKTERIIEALKQGANTKDVAERFGVSKSYVRRLNRGTKIS